MSDVLGLFRPIPSLSARSSRGQGRVLRCMALALVLAPTLAWAQVGGMYWQCQAPSSSNPQGTYCPVNNSYPLPTTAGTLGGIPVTGTQRGLSIASATGFTIPTGATVAVVQAQGTNNTGGQCLFWQDDGTNPTTTAGQALANGQSVTVIASSGFKMIQANTATCTATVSYYK